MATPAPLPEVATPSPAKLTFTSLFLVCIFAGLTAISGSAGVLLYLAHHGKLGAASAPVVIERLEKAESTPQSPAKNIVLEPMLVNLSDPDGHAYLRLGVVLAETPEKGAKEEAKPAAGADAAVRDVILGVLGSKRSAELLLPEGKEMLKKQLKAALNEQVPSARVQSVFFTDFLVQR